MIDEVTIIPINTGIQQFDKSSIEGDMIIDDKVDAIKSSKAKYKILYGLYPWNQDCNKYLRLTNWFNVYAYIKSINNKSHINVDTDLYKLYYNSEE
jgi:hypothetical protein